MNGLLIQWGIASASNEIVSVSLIDYTNQNSYRVLGLKNSGTSAGNSDNDLRVYNKKSSSFQMYSSRSQDVEYLTIGY